MATSQSGQEVTALDLLSEILKEVRVMPNGCWYWQNYFKHIPQHRSKNVYVTLWEAKFGKVPPNHSLFSGCGAGAVLVAKIIANRCVNPHHRILALRGSPRMPSKQGKATKRRLSSPAAYEADLFEYLDTISRLTDVRPIP